MVNPQVLIIMGSSSDLLVMEEAARVLTEFGIAHKLIVASAHRTPEKAAKLAGEARKKGTKIIIAGAGFAAHLAGSLAANTTLPVIGVPLEGSSLQGFDALLSTVQMPGGIPVATMTIGKAGAKNAGIFAAQILSLSDEKIAKKLEEFRKEMATKIESDNKKLNA